MTRSPKEGRGKSENSWIKHGMARRAAGAQVGAFRQRFPQARMLLIDGNAGDGFGVPLDQFDFFIDAESQPTPHMLAELANQYHCALVLCDKDFRKREMLREQFPDTPIVPTHRDAAVLAISGDYDYVLWVSDPNGPAGHGVEHMRSIAVANSSVNKLQRILRSDFIIFSNVHTLNRFVNVKHAPKWQTHQKYVPMYEPMWWLQQLPKRYLARTPMAKPSPNFHFRMLVLSDYLTDGVKRMHRIEIITPPELKMEA